MRLSRAPGASLRPLGRARGRTRAVRVIQSDAGEDLAAAAAAPAPGPAAPLRSLELDAARPREPTSLSGILTPRFVLLANGRLAMMSMAAGMGGELLSQGSFAEQLLAAPPAVLALMVMLAVASIFPLLLGEQDGDEVFGPFTPEAEALNGKVALAALVAWLAIEAAKGSPIL